MIAGDLEWIDLGAALDPRDNQRPWEPPLAVRSAEPVSGASRRQPAISEYHDLIEARLLAEQERSAGLEARVAALEAQLALHRPARPRTDPEMAPLDRQRDAVGRADAVEAPSERVRLTAGASLDTTARQIVWAGEAVQLSALDYVLLTRLLADRGKTVSRAALIVVLGCTGPGALRSISNRLRRRLDAAHCGYLLRTVPDVGIRLEVVE